MVLRTGALRHPLAGLLAWPVFIGLSAGGAIVSAGLLEQARDMLSQRSLPSLDALLIMLLAPVISVLVAISRAFLRLRVAASRRKQERDVARQLASRDPLTGLFNRRGLDQALRTLALGNWRLFLIDLNDFKALNDRHGHPIGDALLQRLAARLNALTAEHGGLAARMGGDEFVLLADRDPQVSQGIISVLTEPLQHEAAGVQEVTVTVGHADLSDGDFADALSRADAAMYDAKRQIPRAGESSRVFEAQLAAMPEPVDGYGVIAIAVNRADDVARPMSYGQAGPLTRAVFNAVRLAIPAASIERLSNDVLGVVTAMGTMGDLTRRLQSINAACVMEDVEYHARLTLGRAGPVARLDLREAVEQAQLAVERARRTGRDLVDFGEGDRVALRDNAALLRDLRAAVANNALELHFQPKLNVRTSTIDSLEALVRWTHQERGTVSPAQFVPLAEESGDIRALTHWVFDAACQASLALRRQGLEQPIFVNVSALLIADDVFVTRLIATAGASEARLGIEVTETACLQQPQRALANLKRLADAGLAIAIDDYGVGLSSLTYLRQMPASELKIDMSFIRDLAESHRDPLIVRSTIDLAHGLGLRVTAEGVDKAETLALLTIMGCDYVQGFHIAPAYPLDRCIDFMLSWTSPELQLPDFAQDLRRFIRS